MGIEDLRSRISSFRQSLYDSASLKNSLSDLRDELAEIIEKELESVRDKFPEGSEERGRREEFLKSLEGRLSLALEALSDYDFADSEARMRYESLAEVLENIKKAERFVKRYGERFTGENEVDFEELLDLMEQLDNLERMEKLLEKLRARPQESEL